MVFPQNIEELRQQWRNALTADDVSATLPNASNSTELTVSLSRVYDVHGSTPPYFFIPRTTSKPCEWLLEKVITNLGIQADLAVAPVVLRSYDKETPNLELGTLSLRQHRCTASAFQVFIDRALNKSEDSTPEAHQYVSEWEEHFPDEEAHYTLSAKEISVFQRESKGTPFSDWLSKLYSQHAQAINSVIPFALMVGVTDLNPGNVIFDRESPENTTPYFVDFESHLDFQRGGSISLTNLWEVSRTDLQKFYSHLMLNDGETPKFVNYEAIRTSIERISDTLTDEVIDGEIEQIQAFAKQEIEEYGMSTKEESANHLRQYGVLLKARREQLTPLFR